MSAMTEKTALVFDTNFIVQCKKDLLTIKEKLSDRYVVYIPQLCIEERIAQRCRDQRAKYDRFSSLQEEYKHIASMNISVPFDASVVHIRKSTQASCDKLVGHHIIPLLKDEATFSDVLERALMKKPPFLSDDVSGKTGGKSPSDKGFKDAVLWITMLHYFKENGEPKVLFLSDDKGFGEQAEKLRAEFKAVTGKDIEIKKNAYIEELTKEPEKTEKKAKAVQSPPLPDIRQLRERIQSATTAVCGFMSEGYWGEDEWLKYFTINRRVSPDDMQYVFSGIETLLGNRLFDLTISPVDVFEIEPFTVNCNYSIPTTALEDLFKLYQEIQKNYPQYIQQFYGAVANIVNDNYLAPPILVDSIDNQLPF